jgi:hypothetical protein
VKRSVLALAALFAAACAPVHRADRIPPGDGPLVGIYKTVSGDEDRATRGMRLSIWAALPDRLHAEVMGPVGGVHFVVDAGGGKVCVIDVDGATAYAGDDDPAAFDALVGIRVSFRDAVGALLSGTSPDGWTVSRDGPVDALPSSIRIDDGANSLALTRSGFARGAAGGRALGSGEPPGTLPVRPLSELAPAIRGDR